MHAQLLASLPEAKQEDGCEFPVSLEFLQTLNQTKLDAVLYL